MPQATVIRHARCSPSRLEEDGCVFNQFQKMQRWWGLPKILQYSEMDSNCVRKITEELLRKSTVHYDHLNPALHSGPNFASSFLKPAIKNVSSQIWERFQPFPRDRIAVLFRLAQFLLIAWTYVHKYGKSTVHYDSISVNVH
jgi:hypothetical protein